MLWPPKHYLVQAVKYEDVTIRDLAEGSANEIKDESLARIREKALARAKELEEEQTNPEAHVEAQLQAEGIKVAMAEPSEPTSAVSDTTAGCPLRTRQNFPSKNLSRSNHTSIRK